MFKAYAKSLCKFVTSVSNYSYIQLNYNKPSICIRVAPMMIVSQMIVSCFDDSRTSDVCSVFILQFH